MFDSINTGNEFGYQETLVMQAIDGDSNPSLGPQIYPIVDDFYNNLKVNEQQYNFLIQVTGS